MPSRTLVYDCVAIAPTPACTCGTAAPTAGTAVDTATPKAPVSGSRAMIEKVMSRGAA